MYAGVMHTGLETTEKLQVCENNWIRRIMGVKRVDKRRMDELRMEVGVIESFKRKLVRSRLELAGHNNGKNGRKMVKRTDALKVEGKRR